MLRYVLLAIAALSTSLASAELSGTVRGPKVVLLDSTATYLASMDVPRAVFMETVAIQSGYDPEAMRFVDDEAGQRSVQLTELTHLPSIALAIVDRDFGEIYWLPSDPGLEPIRQGIARDGARPIEDVIKLAGELRARTIQAKFTR